MFTWILGIIESGGYAGIFFLMILETLFPPIPSELVIPLAGFAAAKGDLNIIGVIIATVSGGVAGCIPWYLLGRLYGIERLKKLSLRFGRILTLTVDDIDKAQKWFHAHGHLAVFFGRLMPTVRSLISVPAGIAHMPFGRFIVYSFLGTFIWSGFLLFFGYVLESQYDKISVYMDFASNAIIVAFISIYLYRLVTFKNVVSK
jgi:membrane protein DedA with SNARE-associated domain